MKLFRDNKYAKKVTKNLSAILASGIILSGCSSNVNIVDLPAPSSPTHTIAIVEPTPNPVAETIGPIVTPEPTPEIGEDAMVFKRLEEQEEADIIEKMLLTNPDEVDAFGWYYSATFYVNGEPKVMFGKLKDAKKSGNYIFVDLFTGEEMFEYVTTDEYGWGNTWHGYNTPPLEFEGIHPYFIDNDIELRVVDNIILTINFFEECSIPIFEDEKLLKYYDEFLPLSTEGDEEKKVSEIAHIYLNVVPRSMWVTGEDLELAREQHVKKLG